ncbi:MAG: FAD-dependent oxidoreductase [Thermoanaerobacteraceae bacterium]|nr:FAD-dependent oxidoreductase [Thermoanaerobacteraceae bacterium]
MKKWLVMLLAGLLMFSAAGCAQHQVIRELPDNYSVGEVVKDLAGESTTSPRQLSCQVVVVGSDPEGIAAAISAARNGMKTVLIDRRDRVGGLYTVGWLNTLDMNYKSRRTREVVNKGIFSEFYQRIGGDVAFDIPTAQKVFEDMLQEAGVQVVLEASDIKPILEENTIKGVSFRKEGVSYQILGQAVIDATQDADIAALSGVPYKFGREDLGFPGEIGATTLVFAVKNVNWPRVVAYLEGDNNPYTGATNKSAWGYEIMFQAPTCDPNIQMRGLNAGRQKDGTVVINALQIFHLNPLVEEEKQLAMERAKAELPGIIRFMRENAVGFENAELAGVAPELYVRESRHIQGEYTLTAEDIFENRNQEMAVAFGSYPIDIQAREKGQTGCALNGINPYGIPFGVMVPQKVDGLLVASRSASYDTVAHGSARTVPVGMALGQAAGVASKIAIEKQVTFREMAHNEEMIRQIRSLLIQQGVDLKPIKVDKPEMKSWAYPYIQRLRDKALLSKGYYNDYKLEEVATANSFRRMFILIDYNSPLKIDMQVLGEFGYSQPLTKEDFLVIVSRILGKKYGDYQELLEEKIIDETTYRHVRDCRGYLTNAEAYALVDGLVQYLIRGRS